MPTSSPPAAARLLIVDDSADIHADFRKILLPKGDTSRMDELERELFGGREATPPSPPAAYEIDSAFQGDDAVEYLRRAQKQGRPYAMAYVDMRMPPGIDGLETIQRLWKVERGLQVVICSAFSDYSWAQIVEKLGRTDQLVILRKPFEPIEVQQLTQALTNKWALEQKVVEYVEELENRVAERTQELLERKQMFEFVLENVTELIAILDEEGRPFYCSPSFDLQLGLPRAEDKRSVPLPWLEEDAAAFRQIISAVHQSRRTAEIRLRLRAADGRAVPVAGTLGPVRLDPLGPPQFILVVRRGA